MPDTELKPDRRPLTTLQAKRLATTTNLVAADLTGRTIAELQDELRWQIDPTLLNFRRICGRVVKRDPVTGEAFPVPFATVHVEDTDFHMLGYYPAGWPWIWYFPLTVSRETIATVKTDACGRFCVWVPRWEIDWILRWRKDRICFRHELFKPRLRDLLDRLDALPTVHPPKPQPDPPPLLADGGLSLRRAREVLGQEAAETLAAFQLQATPGGSARGQAALLDRPAFLKAPRPPLPEKIRGLIAERKVEVLAEQLKVDATHIKRLDPRRFIGPFLRCFDVFYPEWKAVLDVPDITFRVTQDVNGDGTEETIYSEGFFDVRWDAGNIPDVTLEASQIAVAGQTCDAPEVPCEDQPAINFVGLMPLIAPGPPADPYHDSASGYARRPNRPHASGQITPTPGDLPLPLSTAPYAGVLHLYGCTHLPDAAFYRLRYSHEGGPSVPFTGLTWPVYRQQGGVLHVHWPTADADGWYPLLPPNTWFPEHLLLAWPTGSSAYQDGHYQVVLELGNATKAVVHTAPQVGFEIDNSRPLALFTALRWRPAGGAWSDPMELICPVIHRPLVGGQAIDIEVEVSYQISATHLRAVTVSGGGCGGGSFTLDSATATAQHWHQNAGDNAVINTARFRLPGAALPGAYSFGIHASSRAFNPSGGDSGHISDWDYDPIVKWVNPHLPVAVVNG